MRLDLARALLTGERPPVEVDRILTTVLFTDIVGSTKRTASVGDQRWSELLSAHRQFVRSELHHFRGQDIDTAGNGFFATFDGPARAVRCACAIRAADPADRARARAREFGEELDGQAFVLPRVRPVVGTGVSPIFRFRERGPRSPKSA
jgi:class 3 adenylate cyclase